MAGNAFGIYWRFVCVCECMCENNIVSFANVMELLIHFIYMYTCFSEYTDASHCESVSVGRQFYNSIFRKFFGNI